VDGDRGEVSTAPPQARLATIVHINGFTLNSQRELTKSDPTPSAANPKWMTWTGRVNSGVVVLMLAFSGFMKIWGPPDVGKEFERLGYGTGKPLPIAITEITCAVVYAIPQTAVLGAILLTGYLGGATATHVRIDDPFYGPVIGGVLVWLGLYLRDPRLRELVPWRK